MWKILGGIEREQGQLAHLDLRHDTICHLYYRCEAPCQK